MSRTQVALPGNDRCADCADPDPRWCSVNLGVFICIRCSGIHRSLGAHVSKVRFLHMQPYVGVRTRLRT